MASVTRMQDRSCAHCGKPVGQGFMLYDDVWALAKLDPTEVAHLWCVEERLGRPLELNDFEDVPLNQNVKWALKKLGQAET